MGPQACNKAPEDNGRQWQPVAGSAWSKREPRRCLEIRAQAPGRQRGRLPWAPRGPLGSSDGSRRPRPAEASPEAGLDDLAGGTRKGGPALQKAEVKGEGGPGAEGDVTGCNSGGGGGPGGGSEASIFKKGHGSGQALEHLGQ